MTDEPSAPREPKGRGPAWTDEPPASQRAAGDAWTDERRTSEEGRKRLEGRPGGERENRASGEIGIVVGATGAIGQAVVERLTRRGLPVLAVARGKADLDELASAHDLVTPCPADIESNDAIAAIGAALTGLGGADVPVRMAVFAAGLPVRGSADTIDPDALAVGANIKVGGLLRLLHAVRDHLRPGSRFVTFAGSSAWNRARTRPAPAPSTRPCST